MALQIKNHTIQRDITAVSQFDGDLYGGILSGTMLIPIDFTAKHFKSYYNVTYYDTLTGVFTLGPQTCLDAYDIPWKWSTFSNCALGLTSMPLGSFTHTPSTWKDVACNGPYPKSWVSQPHLMSSVSAVPRLVVSQGACIPEAKTWIISTNTWSVSTSLATNITDFPYTLKYSLDGYQPYTVSLKKETPITIEACLPIVCEYVPNNLTIYIDKTSLPEIYNDIVYAVNTLIRPRFLNFLLTNGHTPGNISQLVQVKDIPLPDKRYFKELANNNYPFTNNGNVNYSMVFVDLPTAYIGCNNINRTPVFEADFLSFINTLTSVPSDTYKLTLFNTTSSVNTPNICPSINSFHAALYNGLNPNYPAPYNFAFRNKHINVVNNVKYKNSIALDPTANTTYYTDLIFNQLIDWGIDLINYTPKKARFTLCDSVTATIPAAPRIRLYTNNRFVLTNSVVRFQCLTINANMFASVRIDFGNGNVPTYTGTNLPDYFYETYPTTGYKTITLFCITHNGHTFNQVFKDIINVVNFYD